MLDVLGHLPREQRRQRIDRPPGVAERGPPDRPVIAVLAVVIDDNILELRCHRKLAIRAPRARIDVDDVVVGERALLPGGPAQKLLLHQQEHDLCR